MPRYSYLTHLECPACGWTGDASVPRNVCPDCGGPLLARYDLEAARRDWPRDVLRERPWSMWRYRELLPVQQPDGVVSLGESITPLVPLARVGAELGLSNVLLKDESSVPTGTFKGRGAAVGVSRARELGSRRLVMATAGNAGAAWSQYAAAAGLELLVAMPARAARVNRAQCVVAGARLVLVDGLISDAAAVVAEATADDGWFDVSTLKEPYRAEGKKTMGFELAEQLGWALPDVVVFPTGGGVGVIGIHKALLELRELGWVVGDLPRLVAVQASGCAPVVTAYEAGRRECEPWPDGETVAEGLLVPKPFADRLLLDAIYSTEGCAVAVDDEELLADLALCGRLEGHFLSPEGATTVAAVRKLRESGWLGPDERVVIFNTGAGIKYPETVRVEVPVVTRR